MNLLLDTHAVLWWLAGDPQLTSRAKNAIADPANNVYVSAATAWEVATKHRLGKLPNAGPLAVDFHREMALQGFHELPITWRHGQVAGELPGPHRDPVDRMLIAQAREERMALVSNEEVFEQYGVVCHW